MPIFDLYSKRLKKIEGDILEVYIYNEVPEAFRVQMVHIWDEAIGNEDDYRNSFGPGQTAEAFKLIVMTLRKEYGVFHLSPTYQKDNFRTELASFFLSTEETVKAIDVIELTLKCIDVVCRDWSIKHGEIADETIAEANERLAEHGLGYSYVDGRILRKDSEFTHQEIVKPALTVLSGQIYAGARQEFFGAFENLRVGKNKEALNDCLKSFESTMKAICDKRGWAYPKNATAKTLISCLIENEILPSFWQAQMNSLRSLLESSVPTGRNNLSGHGQGSIPTTVSDPVVQYLINMTASCIVFLGQTERERQ